MLDISKLWKEYADFVFNICMRYVKNIYLAEDIRQEVFLNIITGKDYFKNESSIKTWLYSITFNACMDYFRTMKKQRKIEEECLMNEELLYTKTVYLSDSMLPTWQVNKSSEMPCPISQLFVELFYGEGWSKEDIAKIFGFSLSKVTKNMQKGIEQLREQFSIF